MLPNRFALMLLLFAAPLNGNIQSQQAASGAPPPGPSTPAIMRLDVRVESKSGVPATDLAPPDFTVLDNNVPQPIKGFRIGSGADDPVEVLLVLDEADTRYGLAEIQRDGVNRYLRSNGGKLPFPASIVIVNDHGAQMQKSFSTDGIAMANALGHITLEQDDIRFGTFFREDSLVRMSLKALHQVAQVAAGQPGRKLVLWISPGWPSFSRVFVRTDNVIHEELFQEAVSLSTQLRQARVTLYDVDPSMPFEFYQGYLKGVRKPDDTVGGNVSLQVLAVQSGGRVVQYSRDVSPMIRTVLDDLSSWYEIRFQPPVDNAPDSYHHIEVKVDKPGLTVRTRDGYYANPTVIPEK